jgi:hypothetical protein
MSMTLTRQVATDSVQSFMHMRWGVKHIGEAKGSLAGVRGPGQLFAQLGVTPQHLQRLGVHHMTAKSFLSGAQSQNFRGMMNVSKQMSVAFDGKVARGLTGGFSSSLAALQAHFPKLAQGAKDATSAGRAALSGAGARLSQGIGAVKQSGFFGRIFSGGAGILNSVKSFAGPILGPLSKIAAPVMNAFKSVGNIMRMIPGLNIAFAVMDTFKAVKVLLDPTKSMGEKLAALGKAALSIGAALPIPGASLLGGVRGAWAIGDVASAALKR